MKTSMTHQEYQRLELISDSQSTKSTIVTKAASGLRNIWQALLTYCSTSNDLRVWTTTNIAGQSIWKAYDPTTQTQVEFVSEQELRVWLEERYYHQPAVSLPYMVR